MKKVSVYATSILLALSFANFTKSSETESIKRRLLNTPIPSTVGTVAQAAGKIYYNRQAPTPPKSTFYRYKGNVAPIYSRNSTPTAQSGAQSNNNEHN
jgi:hypothetical protein